MQLFAIGMKFRKARHHQFRPIIFATVLGFNSD